MWNADYFEHELSLYLKFEVLNLSIVIIFKVVHWLKNDESYSFVSVALLCVSLLQQQQQQQHLFRISRLHTEFYSFLYKWILADLNLVN